jgi:signal recognition particle receptor subunit beta
MMSDAKGGSSFFSYRRRLAVKRSLVGVRSIFSILGGLVGLLGLSVASTKVAQAARMLRPQPSILIVGPAAAGKTTLCQYLCHTPRPDEPAGTVVQQRTGRLAADFSDRQRSWYRSKITDDGLGRLTHEWAGRLKKYNSEGMIVIVDTHHSDDDRTYLQELYNSYRDFSTHAKQVNLRVLLILLNKFDLWGRTTASREAMMTRYRTEVFPEIINRFRSSFAVTVQFGYASLTQPEHTPYNHLILNEFLTALNQRPYR